MGQNQIPVEHVEDATWSICRIDSPEEDFMRAARVPLSLEPQDFGLWSIERRWARNGEELSRIGHLDYTILRRITTATLHTNGAVVMEDGRQELCRHLPIWRAAHGRVLVSGLGLGCVVRGLLSKPNVEHIDVVEIDPHILRVIGPEFADNPRVALHHGDVLAIEFPRGTRWDFAWHDIHQFDESEEALGLQALHAKLFVRFFDQVDKQGAWGFPRQLRRIIARGPQRHRFLTGG